MGIRPFFSQAWRRRKPGLGVKVNPVHPLARGLVACYLFGEGGGATARSLVGTGLNLAAGASGPSWVNGRLGQPSVSFAATGNRFFTATLPVSAVPLTLVGVCTPATVSGSKTLINIGSSTVAVNAWSIGMSGGAGIVIAGAGANTITNSTTSVAFGQLACVVGVFAAANDRRVYLNGQGKATSSVSVAPTVNELNVGANDNGGTLNTAFGAGTIEMALVYNRALSDQEALWLYLEPFAFLSPAPSHWSYLGQPAAATAPITWELSPNPFVGNIWKVHP